MGEFIDKAKGKAKQVAGALTGDRRLEREGKLDSAKGNLKGKVEQAKAGVKEAIETEKRRR